MNRISKMLEGLLARTAFGMSKSGQYHSPLDFLFLEILREEGSLAYRLLTSQLKEWELEQIRLRIEQQLRTEADSAPVPGHEIEHLLRTFADELLATYDSPHPISTVHALIHIVSDRSTATSNVLEMYHLSPERLTAELHRLTAIGNELLAQLGLPAPDALFFEPESPGDMLRANGTNEPHLHRGSSSALSDLEQFGTDLTRQAREGLLDPVIGRDREIDRMIRILTRRRKNNPILIGEAGVGKSALVEGLALRLVSGKVPQALAGKRLFTLDMGALVAGTKFRGEFEERIQQLLNALRTAHDTILFIDEIHTIVGTGATQGGLDTANLLKPVLARGEIRVIGATTFDEYRRHIEQDPALERRFQQIVVEPPTSSATLEILRQLAPHYERHHGVQYTDEALQACVTLSARYLTDRHFPDKAIDLLDEAGALFHTSANPNDGPSSVTITEQQIAEVVTSMTGIPTERLSGCERERLRGLGAHLQRRVVGQHAAVERIARAIRRSRSGLQDERGPIGVFLFVGPTGVGKTLLAKEVSKWLFDERRGLIRIDMSEYSEQHTVARLIGSPPGYVGYDDGGQLTEAVRRQPYAVVLLDEIEKAHPDIFNTLLQLFDEGHLTDGSGRRVDFRNTIVIMTSNVGSREAALRPPRIGYPTPQARPNGAGEPSEAAYRQALERTFTPEFLNRVDDIVVFRTLAPSDIEQIIDLELGDLLHRTERLGYRLRVTDRAKRRLASMGYESRYGARALRRTLLNHVEEPLSSLIIDGQLRTGDTVVVESDRTHGVRLRVA